MITHDPLHRSGQGELPHPAPTLGENAQAHKRVRMTNVRRGEPALEVTSHAAPRQGIALAATAQDRTPQLTDRPGKCAQRGPIHGHFGFPLKPANTTFHGAFFGAADISLCSGL